MIDYGHLPFEQRAFVEVFNRPSTVTNTQWMTWERPRGVGMIHILCIGGGAGGGGGFTGNAGTNRGGGAGGGSSATTRVIVPAHYLPKVLYVQVGAGGVGGSGSGVAGSAGIASWVAISPDNSVADNVLAYSGAAPSGGGAGSGSGSASQGGAGQVAAIGSMPLAHMGVFNFIVGQAGVSGGGAVGSAGNNVTISAAGCITNGGASGAGVSSTDQAGGGYHATAGAYVSQFRPIAPAAGPNNGSGGTMLWEPLYTFGGCGGGSDNDGTGGSGGNGAYGSGGGGGGAGVTGGAGGAGGSGLVIITAW